MSIEKITPGIITEGSDSTKRKKLTEYWHEGRSARYKAQPESTCPYERDTPEGQRWRMGWAVNSPYYMRDKDPEHMFEPWASRNRDRPKVSYSNHSRPGKSILDTFILPNGKPIGDCTKKECDEAIRHYNFMAIACELAASRKSE